MSKSSEYKKSCIYLTDPPDTVYQYIKKSVTDFTSDVTYDPDERPGVSNLITIHSLLLDKTVQEICQESKQLNTGQYKLLVADVVVEKLKPIRDEYLKLINDTGYVLNILKDGSLRAHNIASNNLPDIKNKIGFSGDVIIQESQIINQNKKK